MHPSAGGEKEWGGDVSGGWGGGIIQLTLTECLLGWPGHVGAHRDQELPTPLPPMAGQSGHNGAGALVGAPRGSS